MATKKQLWKQRNAGYKEALQYVWGRSQGAIRSYQTPWSKVNDAGVDGIEWNSLVIIGGRPGTGKSLIKDQIVRETYDLNPGQNIRVLQFEFEMVPRVSAIRDFSSLLGLSYKQVCSAGEYTLSEAQIKACHEHAAKICKFPVDIIDAPCTCEEFEKIVSEYMETYATKNTKGEKIYPKVIVSADHSVLFKKALKEGTTTDMLYNLGETCTKLKRKYPLIILMLSQLKREANDPARNEDGKYGNYVLESDIFGGDALMQHADMVIGVNRPGARFIKFYGPERYVIEDDRTLVFHFLKCRNGDIRISFFKAEYEKMQIVEMSQPGTDTLKLKTTKVP